MAGWRDEAIPLDQPPAPVAGAQSWRSQAIPLDVSRTSGPAGGPMPPREAARTAPAQMAPTTNTRPIPPIERKVIGTFFDNGVIYQNPDGTMTARNDGMTTNNQETIMGLMEGRTPAQSWQTEIDRARIDQAPIAARANELVRGVPFLGSRIDEAVGLVSTDARDNMRRTTEAMQRLEPTATAALNLGGAVLGSVPMAYAATGAIPQAVSQLPRWGRALAAAIGGSTVGATEGYIYGSGEGETPEQRRENAREGAFVGGAGGAILGPAGVYAGDMASAVLQRLGRSDANQIAAGLGISIAAARELKKAIGSGDVSTAELMLQRAGPDAILGEAGIPMRQVMDATAQAGGPGAQMINDVMRERMKSATQQVTGALNAELGMPRGVLDLVDDIRTGQGQAGLTPNVPALLGETRGPGQLRRSALYREAYNTPIDYTDPRAFRLDSLLRRVPPSALRQAEELMLLDGEESRQIMATINDNGTITYTRPPDVRQIHYIMQALDGIAESTDGRGVFGRQTPKGGKVENLRSQISQTLRELVEPFARAQDEAADVARQIRAADLGRRLTDLPTPEFAREFRGLETAAERTAVRDGVRSYIDEMMDRVVRTAGDPDTSTREAQTALRAFSSTQNKANLRILLGQEAADSLLDQMDRASTAFELRTALAEGSRTAIRTSLQTGIKESANTGFLRTLMAGEPIRAMQRVVQALTGETAEARQLREQGLYEEIARVLTETSGDRARTALRMINLAMRGQPLRDQQARLVADALAASAVLQSRPAGSYAIERIQGSPQQQ
jgi:hypothetical protein